MSTHHFDATQALATIRDRNRLRRRRAFSPSRLSRLRAELVALREAGASYREIAVWLRQHKRVKVTHTTVMRYLSKLPELTGESHAELP